MDSTALDVADRRPPPPEFAWTDIGVWFIRRNPLYLLSAAAMALTARLLLVDPDTRAGDVLHIMLTLGVLQLYELAVTAVLLLLHRFGRSPEDRPSLMLVATIFWTAPLAASAELTAHYDVLGIGFSVAAAILAAGELETVRRILKLPISVHGRIAALMNLALIAVLPAFLTRSDASARTNEVALLVGWWVCASVLLSIAASARAAGRVVNAMSGGPFQTNDAELRVLLRQSARLEVLWLILISVISGIQLYGMNHAFFLHATPAYAAPWLILFPLLMIECRTLLSDAGARAVPVAVALFPLIGLLLASCGLDAQHVQPHTHWLVAPPLITVSLLAGLVWWYAWRRNCGGLFLHLGSGAFALAIALLIRAAGAAMQSDMSAAPFAAADQRNKLAIGCFVAAAYFATTALVRRSRIEGIFALASLAAGVLTETWRVIPSDRAVAAIALYWFWFIALHIVSSWPSAGRLGFVVAFGIVATIALDCHSPSRAIGWLHAPLIPLSLIALWRIMRRRDYALLAVSATAVPLAYAALRAFVHIRPSAGAITAACAFVLLFTGACVSWFKPSNPRST